MQVDDIVSFTYQAPSATLLSGDYLFGGDVAGAQRALFTMQGTGLFSESGFNDTMLLDGVSVATDSAYPTDGKLHTVELTSTSINIIGTIGARYNGASTFDGIISDFKITRGSDVKRHYNLNETLATSVIIDYGSDGENGTAINSPTSKKFTKIPEGWEGENLITQYVWENPHTAQGEWAFISNQWVLTGTGSSSILRFILDQPEVMRLRGNCAALSGGDLRTTSGNIGADIDSTGNYSYIIPKSPTALEQIYKRASGSVNATIDKPILKQLLEYA